MPPGKNKDLVSRIREGDTKAFEIFYASHRKSVYELAIKYLKDPELAEDAVQDVFMKIWLGRETLNSAMSLRGLLYTSLKNHVLNMLKMNKRRIIRQFEYLSINIKKEHGPENDAYFSELKEILEEGMDQLPKGKQTVYRMKRLEGYSNQEIAVLLDISVNTVKSQFRRANNFLIEYVKSRM